MFQLRMIRVSPREDRANCHRDHETDPEFVGDKFRRARVFGQGSEN